MSPPITDLADDRLVISLDFGTTFSGVAYAFNTPGKKADIVAIHEWPGELHLPEILQRPFPFMQFLHGHTRGVSTRPLSNASISQVDYSTTESPMGVVSQAMMLLESIPLETVPLVIIQRELDPLEVIPQTTTSEGYRTRDSDI